ncbi:nipped-B-like protein [Exaiptasia diaphana]|uniref:Uncharacterized protein n=1 Tax=Exaiptasia diaphana TaxID=2652724 RepID=A0A913YE48_EXADI|nr:nipped-B-like protein [Exaiptasia diaphana]
MNESVPIATLSGITSLTNLLAELPLPCPTASKSQESLFSSPIVEKEAKKVVNRPDATVIHQIKQALGSCKSTQEQIILKDDVSKDIPTPVREEQSTLLNALLTQEPHLFTPENEKLELEDLLGIPSLCHNTISPQMSPNQTVPVAVSPMYAGSPPGLAQVNSPYSQTLHHSPSSVGSPLSSYAQIPQAFSPHRTGQTNIMSPNHQVHLQASNQQAYSPVKTRRMRQSLSHLSPDNSSSVQFQPQLSPNQAGSHTMLPISPRSRNSNRNIPGTTDHMTSPPQRSPGYNSISALEAMASSNGFSMASNSSQNVNIPNSSKINTKSSSPNDQWTLQEAYRTEISKPNHVSSSVNPIEMIDLNSQFSVDKTTLEDVQNISYESTITETTIESGFSYPSTKKSKKNHMSKTLKANKQHDQDVDIYEMNIRNNDLSNNQSENVPETPKKFNSRTIDLNNSVDLLYLDGDQSHNDIKVGSGLTPLKELQLCIPKLVITKIKERRGSKEIETHSVRTVMPGEEEDFVLRKKRRRSFEEGDRQSDTETEKVRPKKKKKMKSKKNSGLTDEDDIMESATFKRFATALENLFEFDDECGVSYLAEIGQLTVSLFFFFYLFFLKCFL